MPVQLDSAGAVSHKQAIDKAKGEYRKYQINELAPVEKEYLETVKDISKKAKTQGASILHSLMSVLVRMGMSSILTLQKITRRRRR